MNLITLDQLEQGGITDANGNDANGMTTRVRTLYIPIQDNITYKVVSVSPVVIRYIHFYNSNRVWMSATSRSSATAYQFTPPSGAAFIRFAFQRTNASLAITPVETANEGKVTFTWDLESAATEPETAVAETNINRLGQLNTSTLLEGYAQAAIRRRGTVYSNEIIEF